MTNVEIIMGNTAMLIADGVLGEEDVIHTYAHWKSLGFQVKRGEKKKEMSEEEAQARGYCFMKNSAWFSNKQVEPIKEQ